MKERIRKLSGTSKKKILAGSSISLFCSYTMPHILRRAKSNNLSLSHYNPIIILFITIMIVTLLFRQFIKRHSPIQNLESIRKNNILTRKSLKSPKEKYASLKINKRFVNPFDEWTEIPFHKTALFWMKRWKGNGIPKSKEKLEDTLPVIKPDLNRIKNSSASVTFTWFGQSTCLMTIDGVTVLSDPVFSQCSVNDYIGPKRLRPIPCKLEDFLDSIDIVIVSHDHFDHLDENAVKKLGNSVKWYVPLGLKNWFSKRKIANVVELDWWQEITHESRPDIKISCVPAMHWSGSRTPFEKNNTLWCSYVVQSKHNKIFFCGDTGYSPELFKAIGNLYSPFTLAAIPIGSFLPTHLMQHLHMGPEDAIKAHIDLGFPQVSVGIHWATFMMSDEFYLAPKQILEATWNSIKNDLDQNTQSNSITTQQSLEVILTKKKFEDSKFITTAFGETLFL